jgi:hypothetical protein
MFKTFRSRSCIAYRFRRHQNAASSGRCTNFFSIPQYLLSLPFSREKKNSMFESVLRMYGSISMRKCRRIPITSELADNFPKLCGCCLECLHYSLGLHFSLLQIFPVKYFSISIQQGNLVHIRLLIGFFVYCTSIRIHSRRVSKHTGTRTVFTRVVDPDPDSVTLWIRIRIGNPDPGARKLRNFSGKN